MTVFDDEAPFEICVHGCLHLDAECATCPRCPSTELPPDPLDLPFCEHGAPFTKRCADCEKILADEAAYEAALADELKELAERDPRPDDGPDERDGPDEDPDNDPDDEEDVPAL